MTVKVEGRILENSEITIRDLHNIGVDLNTRTLFGSYMGLRLHFHRTMGDNLAGDRDTVTREVIEAWSSGGGDGRLYNLPLFCSYGKNCVHHPIDPEDSPKGQIIKPKPKKSASAYYREMLNGGRFRL